MKPVPINPELRPDFDITPNSERSQEEISQWLDVPYIVTSTYDEHRADQTYDEYQARLKSYDSTRTDIKSREEWEAEQASLKADWYDGYPTGIRYEVRCLDGGSWDRATCWGMFGTLDEALACARSKPQAFSYQTLTT